MSLETIPLPGVYNTRGGLAVYGPGTDGNVTITGTVVLNRDMYYNNLTVMGGAQLDTNGYRVFVKDTLNMIDATSVIGRLSNKTSVGSILGGAPSGIKASDTLGGNGGLNPGQNFFGEAEFYNFSQAIAAYKFDAVAGTLRFLMGGSGGASGTIGASGATGSFTLGTAGSPGGVGSAGTRPGFQNTENVPGGAGSPGAAGNPGTPGVGGLGGAGGAAGLGGAGGGVVIVSARNIIGSGIIRADGESGTAGGAGLPGLPGTNGTPGSAGSPGSPAPDFFQAAYDYVTANGYIALGAAPYFYPYLYTNYYNYSRLQSNPVTYNLVTYYYTVSTTYASGGNPGNYFRPVTNPPAPAPVSIRWRAGTTTPGTLANYNAITFRTNYTLLSNPFSPQPINYYYSFSSSAFPSQYLYDVAYNYVYVYIPPSYATQPSIFHTGGAGGAGGAGGTGGIGSAGLPGSPGTAGYAGGGGVSLIITEKDIPQNIDIRAAAGTGDGGLATSGTVIIIKNEAVTK